MRRLLSLFLLIACVSCSVPANFTMYPDRLTGSETLPPDMAIVLVGVTGQAAVDYLQFKHASMPAINARFSGSPEGNTIIAVPVPVGIKQLSLQVYTIAGRGAGYMPTGAPYGFITVATPKIDISTPGLYYIATLDVNQPGKYSQAPIADQLRAARVRFATSFTGQNPVNFAWPAP